MITDGRTDERAGQGTRTPGIGTGRRIPSATYLEYIVVMSPPKQKKKNFFFAFSFLFLFLFVVFVSLSCFGRYC